MVARFTGATLGLLAFTITVVAGVLAHNPVVVTLSRGVFALFLFCLIGLVVGAAAELVVVEHEKSRMREIQSRFEEDSADTDGGGSGRTPVEEKGAAVGT